MFDVWLKSYPDASWHKLVTALNAINEKRVANEIESCYCKQLPGNEISYMHVLAIITACRTCHNELLTTIYLQNLMLLLSALMLVPHMLLLVIVLVRSIITLLHLLFQFIFCH